MIRGLKTELRSRVGGSVPQLWNVKTPTPIVAYRSGRAGGYDHALMVLEQTWREPLGSITPESLKAEGYESFAEFRRYFMRREHMHFTPTREVQVCRIRLWRETDDRDMADLIFERLYGHLKEAGFTTDAR